LSDDTYYVDSLGDVIQEALYVQVFALGLAEGVALVDFERLGDTIVAGINYSLEYLNAAGVENLALLAGSVAVMGVGDEFDNVLEGNELNNSLDGRDGDDTLSGLGGNDALDGGAGTDAAVYGNNRYAYTVGIAGASVTGPEDGADTLVNIERLHFPDKGVAFDLDRGEAAGNTVRIIGAAFGAEYISLSLYVGIGLDLFEVNLMSMLQVCELALGTDLYLSLAHSTTDEDFVKTVYENVVGVAPSPQAQADIVSLLEDHGGTMTQAELLEFAANHPANEQTIHLVGLQDSGVPFI
jgi:hypothetical protein